MRSFAFGSLVLGALAFVLGGPLSAEEKKVKVGEKAPAFESVDEAGKAWKSSDYVGKKILVVYFYPADFTGGCTKQACGFRDDIEKLASKGVHVVGVSGDKAETHAKFKKAHDLNFTLLADEEGKLAKTFGVPVGKGGKASFKGEDFIRGVTIQRFTVVIGRDGTIAAIDQIKDAGGDSKRIAELVKKLEKN